MSMHTYSSWVAHIPEMGMVALFNVSDTACSTNIVNGRTDGRMDRQLSKVNWGIKRTDTLVPSLSQPLSTVTMANVDIIEDFSMYCCLE